MGLPAFKNEAEFRESWITPFLSKMGFILPKHIHGTNEQGKDFYFADHDKFGFLKIYAIQAKLGNIGVGTELATLLDQVDRSFEVTLKYHKDVHERRINAVYIMTNGSISQPAQERIWEHSRRKLYGENVACLDGAMLENLDKFMGFQADNKLRDAFQALIVECNYNFGPLNALKSTSESGKPVFYACRMIALERALQMPFPSEYIDNALLNNSWTHLRLVNNHVSPINISYDKPETFSTLATQALQHNLRLRDACFTALERLNSRYDLTIALASKGS